MPYSILKIEKINWLEYYEGMKKVALIGIMALITLLLIGQVFAATGSGQPGTQTGVPSPTPSSSPSAPSFAQCGYDKNGDGKVADIKDSAGNVILHETCGLCDIFRLIVNIFNLVVFTIAPAVATVLVAVGGFLFLTAGGNPQNLAKGRTILTAVVVGLIIVYGSWLFVNFFFQALGVAEWAGLGKWWQIQCN